ncbi:MAG: elongation factor G [Rhodospirillaceae bacterium]|nr:elongation factor G [Rhodospirillaceae bacterium]
MTHPAGPRCIALVGPQGGGKTSLLESILHITGATGRKGTIKDGTTLGDSSEESKARLMSTELAVAQTEFLGEPWIFLDCPGSVELWQDTEGALMVADAAVVVCEPDLERAIALMPLLRFLDDRKIPHMIFVNKLDTARVHMRDVIALFQECSSRPLLLRQVPIRDEHDQVQGYVDLVSERAYQYEGAKASSLIQIPDSVTAREQEARQELLEHLADFDDTLLEQLLEDVQPGREEIYNQITKDLADDLIVPVLIGAAEADSGVRRLLKALRHEVPGVARVAERLGISSSEATGLVFRTLHASHTGKLSYTRVLHGKLSDGHAVDGEKFSGLFRIQGLAPTKVPSAEAGEVVALGRMDTVATGDLIKGGHRSRFEGWPKPPSPLFAVAVHAENRNDEVKLTAAVQKLLDEDAALAFGHDPDRGGLVLEGQGEVHVNLAIERLRRRFNVSVVTSPVSVPYKETIRKGTHQHARFKRQTGGHGQFGDVHVDIAPQDRGTGFAFTSAIVGGAIPKQYIPGVEAGVRDYMDRGPLGFPVVDVAVTLTDGQFHTVDSSDMAFRTAARMAMQEGMPKCEPVLLEPIMEVTVQVPSDYTARAQRLLSGRRAQILGFDARPGWSGWDEVKAHMPQSEMQDLIIELRSLTLGVGSFLASFSHLQELTGREADKVVEQRQAALAAAQ